MFRGQVEGSGTVDLAINPLTTSLYALERGGDMVFGQITGYRIEADTGMLSRIAAYATGRSANSVLRHGALIYVSNNGDSSVSTYTCGPGGELLAARTRDVNPRPGMMAMDRLGRLFCILHLEAGSIDAYTVASEPVPGELTFADSVLTDPLPRWIAVESGFVYVSGVGGGFSIHALDDAGGLGARTAIEPEGGSGPLVFSPQGRFAFMANRQGRAISVFSIDPGTGLLGSQAISHIAGTPSSLAVDPTGQILLATAEDNSLTMFAIDQATGALSQLGTPVQTGANPLQVAIVSLPD
jgi:6-phosphogluconolactonase (cycloisomerase 2 family)